MSEKVIQAEGVLVTDPFPYQSVEEQTEVLLAKFQPTKPLIVDQAAVTEVYLNLGDDVRGLEDGDHVTVSGPIVERKMVTRSGKIRRGGIYQILVDKIER
ncbi:MAG: hypothetical protein WCC10_12315 [Tumebacillaceae bacterium]